MLRGIFGALKSCVQYYVGVKSRLFSMSLFLHSFQNCESCWHFITTCWTVKSQFTWSLVNMQVVDWKLLCAYFDMLLSHVPLLFFNRVGYFCFGIQGSLREIWVRTPELTYFHKCSLKGDLKDNLEKLVSQSSNKNTLSDLLATMPEILTWRDFFSLTLGFGSP